MEPILILLGLAFAANKIVSTMKQATSPGGRGAAATQVVVWLVAIGVLVLAAHATVTADLVLPVTATRLGDLDLASFVVLGLIAGSTGSVVYDFKKALDDADSAAEPPLFGPTS